MSKITHPDSCYFAHPITDYNTYRETTGTQAIEGAGFVVVNPNSPEHDAEYKRIGMEHFLGVVATCKALAFQRFPDGQIGAGVGKEIEAANQHSLPVYEIHDGHLHPAWPETIPKLLESVLSVDDTRELLTTLGAQ